MLNAQADLSRLVRELCERRELTQKKLAAKPGISYATVNRWENGLSKPPQLAQRQIEELLRSMGKNGADLLKQYFPEEQ